jgi:hypothetical protein
MRFMVPLYPCPENQPATLRNESLHTNTHTMAITQADLAKFFKKPGEKRYDYFLKQVVENEEVYGLADEEGWALLGDDNDADILPLFPAPEFAEAFRQAQHFLEFQVEAVDVNELLEWLEEMDSEGMMVAAFPNLELQGAVVPALHLKKDLKALFDKEIG